MLVSLSDFPVIKLNPRPTRYPNVLLKADRSASLISQVEAKVLKATHGRIRDLKVEDMKGCITVQGSVPSHHTKQLALQGIFESVPTGRFLALITVRKQEAELDSSELLVKASS